MNMASITPPTTWKQKDPMLGAVEVNSGFQDLAWQYHGEELLQNSIEIIKDSFSWLTSAPSSQIFFLPVFLWLA